MNADTALERLHALSPLSPESLEKFEIVLSGLLNARIDSRHCELIRTIKKLARTTPRICPNLLRAVLTRIGHEHRRVWNETTCYDINGRAIGPVYVR